MPQLKAATAQLSIHKPNPRRQAYVRPKTATKGQPNNHKLRHLARKESIHAQGFIQQKHKKNTSRWKNAKTKITIVKALDSVGPAAVRFERLPGGKPTFQIGHYDGDRDVVMIILQREALLDKLKEEQARLKITLASSGVGFVQQKGKTRKSSTFGFIGGNTPGITGAVPAARRNKLLREYNVCTKRCLNALYRWKMQMVQGDAEFMWHSFNYLLKIPTDLYFLDSDVDLKMSLGMRTLENKCFLRPDYAGFQPMEQTLRNLCQAGERDDFDDSQELVNKEMSSFGAYMRNRHGQLMRVNPADLINSKSNSSVILPKLGQSKKSQKSRRGKRSGKSSRTKMTSVSMPSLT